MALPRMRTAAGVLDIIKAEDPGTEVTLYYLRRLIKSGRIPVTPLGRKKLVNADAVIEYLAASLPEKTIKLEPGGIRRAEAWPT